MKTKAEILEKLGIEALNTMQEEASKAFQQDKDLVLLSPTGTGKTLAFLLPLIQSLDADTAGVQAMVLVPSRELAIQIEQVAREMGSGYKINTAYGGQAFSKDKENLAHPPALLIGTPGRIADHLRRNTFEVANIKTLVLDEFDKSLEVGFEGDMKQIVKSLPSIQKKILTSATQGVEIPGFVQLRATTQLDFLKGGTSNLTIRSVLSPAKDKLQTLVDLLCNLGSSPGIVFCNFKDSINRVSEKLEKAGIPHGRFYGGMEQKDRERALIKFRNGTHQLLLATDLAARGIDVPELKFIIHYHLPLKGHEFTHRNGRTARMKADGTAFIIQWDKEELPDYILDDVRGFRLTPDAPLPEAPHWRTLFISGGRKDKISKGDIAGFFIKEGKLNREEVGTIELKQDCAFIAIHKDHIQTVSEQLNNSRLKRKKVRVFEI